MAQQPEPAPVVVANPEPIDVKIADSTPSDTTAQTTARIVAAEAAAIAAATAAKAAAEAAALTTEGQRGINRLWERTQAIIAIVVVVVTMIVIAVLIVAPVLRGQDLNPTGVTALVLLSSLSTNIVTSYFTRTNHTKVGGVGGGSSGRGE